MRLPCLVTVENGQIGRYVWGPRPTAGTGRRSVGDRRHDRREEREDSSEENHGDESRQSDCSCKPGPEHQCSVREPVIVGTATGWNEDLSPICGGSGPGGVLLRGNRGYDVAARATSNEPVGSWKPMVRFPPPIESQPYPTCSPRPVSPTCSLGARGCRSPGLPGQASPRYASVPRESTREGWGESHTPARDLPDHSRSRASGALSYWRERVEAPAVPSVAAASGYARFQSSRWSSRLLRARSSSGSAIGRTPSGSTAKPAASRKRMNSSARLGSSRSTRTIRRFLEGLDMDAAASDRLAAD